MTEDDIRRIVREEIARAFPTPGVIARPALPDAFPMQTLPMPKFDYHPPTYHPPVSSRP